MAFLKRTISLLLVLVLFLGLVPVTARAAENTVIDGEFLYASVDSVYRYPFHYDESWFSVPSTVYQHDLTKMSLRVSMAAGDTRSLPGYENTKGYENIQTLMEDLGFTFSQEYTTYPRSLTKEHYDNIGYSLGSKTITLANGESCTLLMLAIRGHDYGAEWGGNFRMGSSGTLHQGFSTAANKVLDGLSAYVSSLSLSSNVKLWVTGYSRAAATANLVANSASSRIPSLSTEDIYAFCFAAPRNTTNAASNQSSNIVNVVNPIDLVPKFAMSDWGFNLYGTTYFLPGKETSANYSALKASMAEEYRKILAYQGMSQSQVNAKLAEQLQEWDGQCQDLVEFTSALARVTQNRANYVKFYQSSFMDIMAKEMGKANVDVNYAILAITLAALVLDEETSAGTDLLRDGVFKYAHYMELCMAWLDSMDGLVPGSYEAYRRCFVNGPVSMRLSSDSVVRETDADGQQLLILPADGTYSLSFTATASGLFSFALADYDLDSGNTQRVLCYHELPVNTGDQLTATVNANGEVSLTLSNGTAAAPSITQVGSEVRKFTVKPVSAGNGSVSGGGSYLAGQLASVTAYPQEGYVFDGWYLGETCVSTEITYKFAVSGNATLTAKFRVPTQNIQGSWTTDLVLSAADLGVSAPDAVIRATLTFSNDGSASAEWQAMDLTALRLYFRDMFVNAYYAMAYGTGITDLNQIEALCMESTGMSVSDYMDTIVTQEAITAAFTPAATFGSYTLSEDGTAIYTDLAIMDVPSDSSTPNSFVIGNDTLYLPATSWGKPEHTFVCTRK